MRERILSLSLTDPQQVVAHLDPEVAHLPPVLPPGVARDPVLLLAARLRAVARDGDDDIVVGVLRPAAVVEHASCV